MNIVSIVVKGVAQEVVEDQILRVFEAHYQINIDGCTQYYHETVQV
jgi:hypothetical protein